MKMNFYSVYELSIYLGHKELNIEGVTVPVTNNSIGFLRGPICIVSYKQELYIKNKNKEWKLNTPIDISSLNESYYGRIYIYRNTNDKYLINYIISTPEFWSLESPYILKLVHGKYTISPHLKYDTVENTKFSNMLLSWYKDDTNLLL